MRLLQLKNPGKVSLTKDLIDNIPPYAILSHTWGEDDEEVTFQDLAQGIGESKAGYVKMQFCINQAIRDGLEYAWIDTCCIDKSSSNELSEAINSMFRWYREAAKCYVYLSGVLKHNSEENDRFSGSSWESAFRKSRWFTRGWTLQELIAPVSVEFYSEDGKLLGDRKSLEQPIHEITEIPLSALQGVPLYQFSVPERISWAENRQTKRQEDKAYSLMGIFSIHMPLIYGEGGGSAFLRLHDQIDKRSRNSRGEELPNTPQAITEASLIVPFERNPRFTGRESQLAQLEGKLFVKDHTAKIAITGLGGVGKTQLVLELVYRTREKYKGCLVMWIPAINMEHVRQAFLNIAKQLGIPGWEEESADVKKLLQGYLSTESAGRWLLVFDNADDIDMWIDNPRSELGSGHLIEYLPRSKLGCIIFTTRDRKTAIKLAHQNIVEVTEMNEKAATQLLRNYLINEDLVNNEQDAKALLTQLTYLPLAIVQASAYINENDIELADYLSLLEDQEEEVVNLLSEEFQDEGRYSNIKNPVATTWLISFEQIRYRDPLAAEFLSFIACIDNKDVPLSLLPHSSSRQKETNAIGTLNAYAFVSKQSANMTLNLHRLVHLAMRNWLRKEGSLTPWAEKAVTRLNDVFPDNDFKNRSVWRRYLTHARCALESDLIEQRGRNRISLARNVGMCLYSDGRFLDAESYIAEVLETDKMVLGPEHPNTLTSIANLALTYLDQGRWREAEDLYLQVIETRKRVLGPEHPDTLTSIANLASTYWNQGRWKEAEDLYLQVMETRKRVLGPENPDTLTSIANLALTYLNQGRWKEAEDLEVQVVETRKRVLGPEHPDTLTSIANLALTYLNQGRWKEAEDLYLQVMAAGKRVLGPEHPDTLTSMANLACTFQCQGRYDECIELMCSCVRLQEKILGVDHPRTISSLTSLRLWKKK